MTATRLILVRHGQAHCNTRGVIGGPLGCTGLTDQGRAQVHQLAATLRTVHGDTRITAAYTTPLRRARDTADIIAAGLNLSISTVDDLREPDYGSADGRRWDDVVAESGIIPNARPDHRIAPGAETWRSYLHRTSAALRDILARHSAGVVLIVGHGETVTAAAHLLLGLTAEARANAAFAVDYASITQWEQQPLSWTRPDGTWRWTLLRHNDTAHLANQHRQQRLPRQHRTGVNVRTG